MGGDKRTTVMVENVLDALEKQGITSDRYSKKIIDNYSYSSFPTENGDNKEEILGGLDSMRKSAESSSKKRNIFHELNNVQVTEYDSEPKSIKEFDNDSLKFDDINSK